VSHRFAADHCDQCNVTRNQLFL